MTYATNLDSDYPRSLSYASRFPNIRPLSILYANSVDPDHTV